MRTSTLAKATCSLFALAMASTAVLSSPPAVDITRVNSTALPASGPIYLTLPSTATVTVTVTHADASGLNAISALDILVNDGSMLGGAVSNAFVAGTGQCSATLLARTRSCTVNSAGTAATMVVPWPITLPGVYSLSAQARHGESGTDAESVEIRTEVVSVEYPAPPAVANAYINAHLPRLRPGVRGCIINQVAHSQAWAAKYGPHGGPYQTALIEADVNALRATCGN